jgi:hypothetical protein
MPKWLSNLKEFLSLDNRSVFILASLSWAFFLIPKDIWQNIGLVEIWIKYRPFSFIGGVVFSIWFASGIVFDFLKFIASKINNLFQSIKDKNNRNKTMLSLSKVEKEILALYVQNDTTTMAFEIRDGIVNGLIAKKILFRSSNLTNPMSFDLDTNISSWAWKFLHKQPDFLTGIVPPESTRHSFR